jgi:hypothetical protein
MIRFVSFLLAITFFVSYTPMQSKNTGSIPCSTKEYNQFDFWLREWNVFDTKNNLIGTNKIVKMPNACTLQENWKSKTSPSKGTSYNYYDASDDSWNQLWIDNVGGILKLKGKYNIRKMILKSDLVKSKDGVYYNQITWFDNSDGTVTQLWELLNENHTVFNELFRGTYKKIIK